MDEMGVHSPLNVKKSTVSDRDTASPAQTVTGKDLSNPLMAVTLPKSEKDKGSSSRRRLPLSFNQTIRQKTKKSQKNKDLEFLITQTVEKLLKQKQEKDKHINPSPIQSPRQESTPNNLKTVCKCPKCSFMFLLNTRISSTYTNTNFLYSPNI